MVSMHRIIIRRGLEELEGRDTPSFTALPAFTAGVGAPTVVASGDFNGDGFADLAVGNDPPTSSPSIDIDLGNGDGTFTQVQQIAARDLGTPQEIVVADLNQDGIPDLAVASFSSTTQVGSLMVFLGDGKGTFTGPSFVADEPMLAVGVADFDNNGTPDLVGIIPETATVDPGYQIFPGNGDGTFSTSLPPQPTTATANRVVTADFDDDGNQDFIVLDAGDNLMVPFFGDGMDDFDTPSPGFVPLAGTPVDFAVGHFGGGALPDLVVAENTGLFYIPNLGGRQFNGEGVPIALTPPTGVDSFTRVIGADLNGDGATDVIAMDQSASAQVFTSLLNGKFAADPDNPYAIPGDTLSTDVAAGDIDGDGTTDFVVVQSASDPAASQGLPFLNFTPIPTQTSLAAAPNPVEADSPVLLTAAISFDGTPPGGKLPSGTVTFFQGDGPLGQAPVIDGQATLTLPGFPVGNDGISAFYSGDLRYEPSDATGLVLTVNPKPPTKSYMYQVTGLPTQPGIGPDRVASGSFNSDDVPDILLGSGGGQPAKITIIDGQSRQVLLTMEPFGADYTGGLEIAAGDIDGDGLADVAVAADSGGGPRVQIFLTRTTPGGGIELVPSVSFYALDPSFTGGLRIALGDIDGDGRADLVVTGGPGAGPRVAVYDGRTLLPGDTPERLFNDFFALDPDSRQGLYVAVGDLNNDGYGEIAVSSDTGGSPRVNVFDGRSFFFGSPLEVANFFAGDPDSRGGVRIAIRNVTGADDGLQFMAGDGPGTGSTVRVYSGIDVYANTNPTDIFENEAFPGFDGGVFVA